MINSEVHRLISAWDVFVYKGICQYTFLLFKQELSAGWFVARWLFLQNNKFNS